ncbi:MAG: helix-turn-helix transcriptional regulator [Clostridia bacterium]|nr:helix-turn-helix transcriptional regulator [Clostridia bacterium]
MAVRYDKLWRLLSDNKMTKKELAKAADLSSYAMTKLNQNRPVSMEIIMRFCKIFHCDVGDIMEIIEED